MKTNHFVSRTALLLTLSLAAVMAPVSPADASLASNYPLLPDLPGADIPEQDRLVIYLDRDIPLVEVEGQLYAIGDRPLEVDFRDLDHMTVLFVVPQDSGVFVTEGAVWKDELEPSMVSSILSFDLVDPLTTFGFELAPLGQPAPTVPDVVIQPTENEPDPV